ncbi:helix-turn-helix transcriptional regulator [Chryseobacterium aquaticum]|uniref:Helix-turn-helix transcriptional regulator n=1 Tax=Chryseobacterium aquaticum TaxID=452084 RepID=A0A848NB81_9FLAO|nr:MULTISPECIES: helix-turn-helix domain-containing protein [Chryseobacterium]NMR35711.1 helix-turn-helix transcriptional regulator [Chryseobacterium aquaticum]NRQ47842.1 helix-turn-helix transcriptional regulator [Chryseobacterium sp. C-204]
MKNNTIIENEEDKSEKKIIFDENSCPVTATMKVLGGKWKAILINAIYHTSPARFGELRRSVKGITQSMLTSQLRELEDDGIINRKIYAEIPPRVEYTLTEFGLTLSPIILSMADWGKKYKLKKKKQD